MNMEIDSWMNVDIKPAYSFIDVIIDLHEIGQRSLPSNNNDKRKYIIVSILK